jgi:hypothetical protein
VGEGLKFEKGCSSFISPAINIYSRGEVDVLATRQ